MNKALTKLSAIGSSVAASYGVAMMYVQDVFAVDLLGGEDITPSTGYASNLGSVINSVLNFIMVIAALLVLLYLVWGGIEWITSGGDKGKTESARNKITSAVIGLIILASAYAIFLLVINFLGFSNTGELFNVEPINNG